MILADSLNRVGGSQLRQRVALGVASVPKWRIITSRGTVIEDSLRSSVVDRDADADLSLSLFGSRNKFFINSGLASVSRKVFLPVGYPKSTTSSYTPFIRYNIAHVSLIALARTLSTQAMLLAVGFGQGGALPMAAVVSWLLKDGLGHLGSILVGTSINTKFDSDPKRFKFLSVFLGQAANLLGILSLAKPGLFLLLTSFSSALSRVGTLAFTSSRARIYENFATAGNLGDLMRCSQAQSTLATILGTAVGVALAPLVGGDVGSILAVFAPVSAATHVFAYKAVSIIELRTLNVQRMEVVVHDWLANGTVPSVTDVAKREHFIITWPKFSVSVNPPIDSTLLEPLALERLTNESFHVRSVGSGAELFLKDSADAHSAIKGMFEACVLCSQISAGVPQAEIRAREIAKTEWPRFLSALPQGGWDVSVAFIDNVNSRISIS